MTATGYGLIAACISVMLIIIIHTFGFILDMMEVW